MTGTWIGVDPGARYSGITAVDGRRVIDFTVIDRDRGDPDTYLDRVEDEITLTLQRAFGIEGRLRTDRVAIEDIVEPTPHMGIVSVRELLATAVAVGHLTRAFAGSTLIRPNKHGHRPWATYPPDLITPGEQRHAAANPTANAGQSSLMRHARSAYDVATAAAYLSRLAAPRRPA